jgi:biotin operon repressor
MKENTVGVQYVSTPYALIKRFDLTTSAIYGFIWSKQQLSKGYCCVSQETIGRELGISPRTVYTKMKLLENDGFIKIVGGGNYIEGAGRTLNIVCDEDVLKELDTDKGIISKKREASYHLIEGEPAPGEKLTDFLKRSMKAIYGEE